MSIMQNSKIRRITDSTLVVGADIAKKVHVARASDARGVELGKPLTFDDSRYGFEKLLTWIRSLMLDHSYDNVIFGVEPTGHYWLNLAQFLRHEGIHVVLVNPLHVKKTKELEDNSPTKNDRKDARVISLLVKDGRYSVPHIPEDIYADLRVGMNERDRLSEDLKRVQARVHNWLDRFFPEFTEVFKCLIFAQMYLNVNPMTLQVIHHPAFHFPLATHQYQIIDQREFRGQSPYTDVTTVRCAILNWARMLRPVQYVKLTYGVIHADIVTVRVYNRRRAKILYRLRNNGNVSFLFCSILEFHPHPPHAPTFTHSLDLQVGVNAILTVIQTGGFTMTSFEDLHGERKCTCSEYDFCKRIKKSLEPNAY